MATLFGVFLFMGVNALNGMQLFDRILLLFMPAKYQPDYPFLRYVNTKRVHLYTLIQVVSTSMLYLVKFIDSIAITFPILVLATCGIRKMLDYVFTQRELFWLDDILPGSKLDKKKSSKKQADEEERAANIEAEEADKHEKLNLINVSKLKPKRL